jgi:DNA-binding response OmpR family regulator
MSPTLLALIDAPVRLAPPAVGTLPALRVLVAVADPAEGRALGEACREVGWQPVFAFDPQQVVLVALEERPDVVVLDAALPGGDVRAAVTRLRRCTRLARVPVAVVDPRADGATVDAYRAAGADALLPIGAGPEAMVAQLAMLVLAGAARQRGPRRERRAVA